MNDNEYVKSWFDKHCGNLTRAAVSELWRRAQESERESCATIADTAAHKLGGYQFTADAIRKRSARYSSPLPR